MKSYALNNLHRSTKLLLKLSTILLATLSHTMGDSGVFSGVGVYYITSSINTKYIDNDPPNLAEKQHYAVSGFAQGVTAGYCHKLKDQYHIGLLLEYLWIDSEEQSTHTVINDEKRRFLLTLHHALYPSLTFGFSPSENTMLSLKAGYGSERWSSDMNDNDTRVLKISKHDGGGRIIGAEMLTMLQDKFLFGLSIMHSSIDRFYTSDSVDCTLCHSPETLSVGAKIQYQPNGVMAHSEPMG